MKQILKELIEIIKDVKPEITECSYSPFEAKRCRTCTRYLECEEIHEHHEKCNDLLNKLKVKNLTL